MLHLVTGYAGTDHITSANDGAMNIHSVGAGQFVVKGRGREFAYNLNSNNEIAIFDGDGYINGRYFTMTPGTSEKLEITNGAQNMFRNDLVVARYTMNNDDGIEKVALMVIEGEDSSTAAVDPEYNQGSIDDGDNPVDFPLYRIKLNGLNVEAVEPMFQLLATGMDIVGNTDISDIGDGTITGGISELNSNLELKQGKISTALGTRFNITIPSRGWIEVPSNVRPVIPTGKSLISAHIETWSSNTGAFSISRDGRYLYGTPNCAIVDLQISYVIA